MLNTITPDEIYSGEKGLIAKLGSITLIVEASERDSQRMLEESEPIIYTQLETDDLGFYLLGFFSEERRSLYQVLNKITGIGRRSALTVLECGECRDTLRAVSSKDSDYFAQVPGVGKSRVSAIMERLAKVYRDALPVPSNIKIQDWVVIREALIQIALNYNYEISVNSIDYMILNYQENNQFVSSEMAITQLQDKITPE